MPTLTLEQTVAYWSPPRREHIFGPSHLAQKGLTRHFSPGQKGQRSQRKPFLPALQKALLPCEGLARLTEGQGAAGHTKLQRWQQWRMLAAHREYAVSNGLRYSLCKLKMKINQTLKLISFPSVSSVCSAVPVGSSPPSPVHPNFTLGLGSSGCCQGLCRPGELQAAHSSLGKSSKGQSSRVSEAET